MGWTPSASNAPTLSSPPLYRSGRPASSDRFIAVKPNAPIFSKDVCRSCQMARSWTLIPRRGWFCDGAVETSATTRSASGKGSPLNIPPFTTQKTVVLSPMPRPKVRTATTDRVGYLMSMRIPDRTSENS
jgi:hypothetical protein